MREININLSNLEEQYDCGHCGEAKASELKIDISNMAEADFYVVVFKNSFSQTYCTERFYAEDIKENVIRIALWQDLTKTDKERAVVEAYIEENGKLKMLEKSPVIHLHFDGSISSDKALSEKEPEGLYLSLLKLEGNLKNDMDVLNTIISAADNSVRNANTAADNAKKITDEITDKLNNGELKGEKGDTGAIGPPGATGPPGKDAVKPLEFMRASKYLNGTFPSLNCCEGRYVYIASYGNIYKVDFGIESSPVEEVKINLNNKMSATGIAIKGQYIYACYRDGSAGTSRNEDIPAGILYVFRKSDLSIVKEIMLDWKPTRVIIHNNLMIVNMQLKGWNMYDITNLQSPSLIYSYRSENEEYQGGTFCEHNERLYYIAGGFGYGLYIYDVTDASVPEKAAEFKFSWYSELNKNVHCYDVVADYPYVYTTVASTYSKDLLTEKDIRGILKLDISDMSLFTADTANLIPYTITQIADEDKAAVNPGGDVMPTKMTRYKDYLLTNTGRNGIAVFDISKDEPIYQRFVQTSKEGIPFTLSTSDDERIIISESMKEKYVHILRPII